jgi:hypothetical protein
MDFAVTHGWLCVLPNRQRIMYLNHLIEPLGLWQQEVLNAMALIRDYSIDPDPVVLQGFPRRRAGCLAGPKWANQGCICAGGAFRV